MRRLRLATLVLLFAMGCASGASEPGPNDGSSLDFEVKATVVIDDTGIHPELIQARVGDAVTVANRGSKDHGLTSDTIDTGTLRAGESTTIFFTETGSINVTDRTDSSHTARIEVSAAPSS